MYLHENREMFKEVIEQVAEASGRLAVVIEKDYYVTMILRLLSQKLSNVVFKGGTSLSKGFKAILLSWRLHLVHMHFRRKWCLLAVILVIIL